jgi:hypothetical protein
MLQNLRRGIHRAAVRVAISTATPEEPTPVLVIAHTKDTTIGECASHHLGRAKGAARSTAYKVARPVATGLVALVLSAALRHSPLR